MVNQTTDFSDVIAMVKSKLGTRLPLTDHLSTEEDMRRFIAALAEKVQANSQDLKSIKLKLGI